MTDKENTSGDSRLEKLPVCNSWSISLFSTHGQSLTSFWCSASMEAEGRPKEACRVDQRRLYWIWVLKDE